MLLIFFHNPDIFSLFCWTQALLYLSFSIKLTLQAEEYIPTETKVGSRNYFIAAVVAAVLAACCVGEIGSVRNVAFLRATSLKYYFNV